MKIIYLFIVFTLLNSQSAFSRTNNFGKLFVDSLRSKHRHTCLKDAERQLLIENINKEANTKIRKQANYTDKIYVETVTLQNISEIIQAIIQTEKDINKFENNKNKYDSLEKLHLFIERFSKQYPNEIRITLLNYLNNTNNWIAPKYRVLGRLLGGTDDSFSNINDTLLNKYITLYRKLSHERRKENKRMPPNFKGDRPVEQLTFAVENCLQEYSKTAPLPMLEEMLKQETNAAMKEVLLFGVGQQPSDKAAKLYAKYKIKFYGNNLETRQEIKNFKKKCMRYEKWNKRLKAAGYDKKKAEKQFKAEVDAMKQKLKSINYNNPKDILQSPELLHQAEDLAGEKPQSGIYPDRYLKPIKRNPVPECKKAYWQILQRTPDEKKYKIEPKIALVYGKAYGKVMSKEDVSKVIDYMNKQKSFKLIELMGSVLGKEPKVYKKLGSMNIIEGIRFPARKEIIQEFYKNKDKIKDNFIKKGIIEMAEDNGVAK